MNGFSSFFPSAFILLSLAFAITASLRMLEDLRLLAFGCGKCAARCQIIGLIAVLFRCWWDIFSFTFPVILTINRKISHGQYLFPLFQWLLTIFHTYLFFYLFYLFSFLFSLQFFQYPNSVSPSSPLDLRGGERHQWICVRDDSRKYSPPAGGVWPEGRPDGSGQRRVLQRHLEIQFSQQWHLPRTVQGRSFP